VCVCVTCVCDVCVCCAGGLCQRALGLSGPEALLPVFAKHLRAEPYSLAELESPDAFGQHPNTLFEGAWGSSTRTPALPPSPRFLVLHPCAL
jgi:hypothetical protein